jgi:DNA-binding LytR/AlgR family response regulator
MINYKCIIIDDDAYAIEGLKKYIELIPTLVFFKSYTDPLQALLELVDAEEVDLILMDIDMPYISGIELSKILRKKTRKLVFTTAYTQYGYDAFQVSADAYLLKPYSLTKFAGTITRLFALGRETVESVQPNDDYFFVKRKDENHTLIKIYFKDINAVESKQNYVMIYTVNQQILTYMSLTEIAGILGRLPIFVKYHRSFIINQEHISSITGNTLKMANGMNITVGENFRKDFMVYLEKKLLKTGRRL